MDPEFEQQQQLRAVCCAAAGLQQELPADGQQLGADVPHHQREHDA
jgi:hypothetical protein